MLLSFILGVFINPEIKTNIRGYIGNMYLNPICVLEYEAAAKNIAIGNKIQSLSNLDAGIFLKINIENMNNNITGKVDFNKNANR